MENDQMENQTTREEDATEEQKPKGNGLPSQFVAVFYDDSGELQIGSSGFFQHDLIEWALMLRAAADKLELQHHRMVREQVMQQRQGNGLIVPR